MIRSKAVLGPVIALACLLLAPAQMAAAQPYDQTESRNLATVQAGFDAWANGTGSPYDALAEDATWEIVGNSLVSRVYTGKEDFIANVIRPFNARMSTPLRPTIRDIYADGDTVIVFFDAEGIARDGVPYRNTYAWFLTLRDNRIVKASAFFDSIAFNDFWHRVPA
jgi:ketosteroid isomerase-like protein